MKNIMTTMSINITNIATMNIALVGMNTTTTMNMIIMDTAITAITSISTMNIAPVDMTTTDTIIQAAAANIITAPQKRW